MGSALRVLTLESLTLVSVCLNYTYLFVRGKDVHTTKYEHNLQKLARLLLTKLRSSGLTAI